MKKDYTAEIDSLYNKKNEIMRNLIADIKEYMNEHGIKKFRNRFPFFDDIRDRKEKNREEYNSLYMDTCLCSFQLFNYNYCFAEPVFIELSDDGELVLECFRNKGDHYRYLEQDDKLKAIYGKDLLVAANPLVLNCLFDNLQNEKFHRMNELIKND